MTKAAAPARIPLCRPDVRPEDHERVRAVMDSGYLVAGSQVHTFETGLSQWMGGAPVAAVSSGTAALHLALLAADVGVGDEVIVPCLCWPSAVNMVERIGAIPVPVDAEPHAWAMCPDRLEAALTAKTKAVVGVHLFGAVAPWSAYQDLVEPSGVALIEDAACAIGATYQGRPCGTLAEWGVHSFHPRKLVTTAEGGAVVTTTENALAAVKRLANHGFLRSEPAHERFSTTGFNYRMSDVHAAIGVGQLDRLAASLTARRELALAYRDLLAPLDLEPLPGLLDEGSVVQTLAVLLPDGVDRDAVIRALREAAVESTVASFAAHRLPHYQRSYGWAPEAFPVADRVHDQGLALPLSPQMSRTDVERVCEVLGNALR